MENQPQKPQKVHYPVGTILAGYFGWIYTYTFYQVTGHTKGGNPRIVALQSQKQVVYNTPAQGDSIVTPIIPPPPQIPQGSSVIARFNKWGQWQLKAGNSGGKTTLDVYDPNKEYHNCWYG
jgi:hypothetical protein